MDGPDQIFDSSLEFHGSDGLGDQFGRLRANNVTPRIPRSRRRKQF